MGDPVVCSFLTKTLCAEGGRLGLAELQQHVGLSAQQLRETLQAAGPERFLLLTGAGGAPEAAAAASGGPSRAVCARSRSQPDPSPRLRAERLFLAALRP